MAVKIDLATLNKISDQYNLEKKTEKISINPDLSAFKTTSNALDINGKFHLFWSHTREESAYTKEDTLNGLMEGDARLNINYNYEINNFLNYTANFEVKKKYNNRPRLRGIMGFDDTRYGKLELATYRTLEDDLLVSTGWITKGSGGAWDRNINRKLDLPSEIFSDILTGFDTVTGHNIDDDAPSITYYSPKNHDLKIGFSYMGDTRENMILALAGGRFSYKNVLTFGALYDKKLSEDLSIKLSLFSENGTFFGYSALTDEDNIFVLDEDLTILNSANDSMLKKFANASLKAWYVSSLVKYKAFSAVALYGFWGDSGHPIALPVRGASIKNTFVDPQDTHYLDLAASYAINDKVGASIGYFYANSAQDYVSIEKGKPNTNGQAGSMNFQNFSIAADYKLLDSFLKPYIELNRFIVKDNSAIIEFDRKGDNKGIVAVLGARSQF